MEFFTTEVISGAYQSHYVGRMVICGLKLSEIQKRVIASLPKRGTCFPNEDPVSQMGGGGPVFLKGTWRVETAIFQVMKGPASLRGTLFIEWRTLVSLWGGLVYRKKTFRKTWSKIQAIGSLNWATRSLTRETGSPIREKESLSYLAK